MVSSEFDSAESAALEARHLLGVGETSRLDDILSLLEDVALVPILIAKLPDGGPDGVYTRSRRQPFILVNSCHAAVRQRFTLAHEFGHHVLKHGERWDQHINPFDKDPKEVEANRFASEFLVPRPALDWWLAKDDDPKIDLEVLVRFAHHFRVSCEMARYRLERAKRLTNRSVIRELDEAINEREHRRLHRELRLLEVEDGIAQAEQLDVRVPKRLKANIFWAVEAGLVKEDYAAKRLRLPKKIVTEELRREGVNTAELASTPEV